MREKIRQLLIELRLKGMQNVLDPQLDAAEKNGHPRALIHLVQRHRKIKREKTGIVTLTS